MAFISLLIAFTVPFTPPPTQAHHDSSSTSTTRPRGVVWTSVHLIDGRVEEGVIHTIDPETGNIVLLQPTVWLTARLASSCCFPLRLAFFVRRIEDQPSFHRSSYSGMPSRCFSRTEWLSSPLLMSKEDTSGTAQP